MNTKEKILELVKKEDIEAISIGEKGWNDIKKPIFFAKEELDKALQILDFEFDGGFGGENGYAIYVWTKDKIIVKGCYDGSEWYTAIPRNPDNKIVPTSIGGG